ncbi:hypothetical protein D3C71_1517870 [compost metagenome]
MPTLVRQRLTSVAGSVKDTPSTRMVPLSMVSRPFSVRSKVLLPDPDGPTTTMTSPLFSWQSTPSSARCGGCPSRLNVLVTAWTSSKASATDAPRKPRLSGLSKKVSQFTLEFRIVNFFPESPLRHNP